jgi:molybdopterin-guanine dinucleotide biosynthesis protein A
MEGFILIGGKSSRMGKDKFALTLNGKTFFQITCSTLQTAQIEKVSAVVSDRTDFADDVPIIKDIFRNRGALGGIHSALVNSSSDLTIILACDYPFVSVELIMCLINIARVESQFDVYVPIQEDGKIQPLCAIYKTEPCRPKLSEMLENRNENYSVRDFLNLLNTRYIKFTELADLPNAGLFFLNVNTPEDFARAAFLSAGV